jgi:hypothetical protein
MFTGHPCDYFLWGYLKGHVFSTNQHTVQEFQVETEAVAEEITGYNFVVYLR